MSKIYFISIIKLTIDLVNIECDTNDINYENNTKITGLINELEILHDKFDKYYDWNGDFYFNDYDIIIPKSFLTYISNKNHKYYSISDIKIKCFILEDFFELYECSKFKKNNKNNKYIELSEIKIIYNELKNIK